MEATRLDLLARSDTTSTIYEAMMDGGIQWGTKSDPVEGNGRCDEWGKQERDH